MPWIAARRTLFSAVRAAISALLMEDGSFILAENGDTLALG